MMIFRETPTSFPKNPHAFPFLLVCPSFGFPKIKPVTKKKFPSPSKNPQKITKKNPKSISRKHPSSQEKSDH
jgi:hypothetical protein